MFRTAMIASVFALIAPSAFATDFMAAKAVCAEALANEVGRSLDEAKTKLVKAREGGVLKVTVELKFDDGEKAFGECKVRSGEVLSLTQRNRA